MSIYIPGLFILSILVIYLLNLISHLLSYHMWHLSYFIQIMMILFFMLTFYILTLFSLSNIFHAIFGISIIHSNIQMPIYDS